MALYDELKKNREQILAIAARNKINKVRLFGSVLHGNETPDSDIDFLVTPLADASLLDLGGFLVDMEYMLGRKVDVVEEGTLHWSIRDEVMREAQTL